MRLFTGSDKEVFEEMVEAIQACTLSTEMLFRDESILPDTVEELRWFGVFSVEDIAEDALKFPENWA